MRVQIDATAGQFELTAESDEHGDQRRYYVHGDRLMIVVCRGGLALPDLVGCVVDASLGWHDGARGFVRPGNADKRHSKLTIYRVVEGKPEKTLAQIVDASD